MIVKKFLTNKMTLGLIGVLLLASLGGVAIFKHFNSSNKSVVLGEEVDLAFDPEGPYALLVPRKDGNALILNLKRTASYDSISYELAYNAEGIDRGVVGNVDTSKRKGEYEQEILFGTCSKNVCKYDAGVENGTLTLHITKGGERFRMITEWHLQRLDLAGGTIASGDNHFTYKVNLPKSAFSADDSSTSAYTIINELSGSPKLPANTKVVGKVYAVNLSSTRVLPPGQVTEELAQKPPAATKIYRYADSDNSWSRLDTKQTNSQLSTTSPSQGIFAILVN